MLKKPPSQVFKCGDIVLIPLDDVDRTKVDGANLAGVIVLINKDKSTCTGIASVAKIHMTSSWGSWECMFVRLGINIVESNSDVPFDA